MTFSEAAALVSRTQCDEALPLLLAMSGTAGPLPLFVQAVAAKRRCSARVRTLPFNTLAQALRENKRADERELFLILPWDFVPEADWRSGLPAVPVSGSDLRRRAEQTAELIAARDRRRVLYLPAPLPPILSTAAENAALEHWLIGLASGLDGRILPAGAFSLGVYLATGCPFAGAALASIAEAAVDSVTSAPEPSCKVLVTDLDNVLWSGVVAEDGIDGVHCGPEGAGFKHFIFQTQLAKLKRDGVLLCAVSRNDLETATGPFRSGRTCVAEDDFVALRASYRPKSVQIEEIARRLNLGLESFVFVDDNPIELAEVSERIPSVRCLRFPSADEDLPAFCRQLAQLFGKSEVTDEDRQRTELYRRRIAVHAPLDIAGADLTAFLAGLEMQLTVHRHAIGDHARAVQLINKTNQFNLNGRRVTAQEVDRAIALGGRLYGATLEDRTGSHGEILACLVLPEGTIASLVMSCRVLQRRVEYAFLAWLADQPDAPRRLDFAATPRNEPFQSFLDDAAFDRQADGCVHFDPERFGTAHAGDIRLFSWSHHDDAVVRISGR